VKAWRRLAGAAINTGGLVVMLAELARWRAG
jgi:hypothetical protein